MQAEETWRRHCQPRLRRSLCTRHEKLWHISKPVQDLIFTIAKDKHEHFPNLKGFRLSLYIGQMDAGTEDAIARMRAKCKDAGFDLTIHCSRREAGI